MRRAAIIGYGLAGRFFHAPLIAATSGLAVGAVLTADPERRAQVSEDHPDAVTLSTLEELWDTGGCDFVVVAAPTDAHVPLARAAIDHGMPVVVDKPLASTAEQAQALVEHAARAGVLLTVFQNRRWDSDQLTLARLITGGRLGTVLRHESRFERWRPDADPSAWRHTASAEHGGGQLLDLGSHLVDQALHRFGPVSHVYAEIDARRGMADDDCFLALRHSSGVISHLRASATTAAPGPRLRVLGSRAAFIVDGLDSQEDALRAGRRPGTTAGWGSESEADWGRLVTGDTSEPVPSEPGDWPDFYARLASALHDGGPPPVDPVDAVAALTVLDLARRSARERTVVPVG